MTAVAEITRTIRIEALDRGRPILFAPDRTNLSIRGGTIVEIDGAIHRFPDDTFIAIGNLEVGKDYAVTIDASGQPVAEDASRQNPLTTGYFAGFHFAPSAHAQGVEGGDTVPAINPYSLWDTGFRPSCHDPRGMALVDVRGRRVWVDIYLLGVDHHENGTSRHGATIADGRDLPARLDGSGAFKRLDYATAAEIYGHHGKRLLAAEEFFASAYGVKERCSRSDETSKTGALDDDAARFISQHGIFDATGTMWQWGTDGHPDDPRPSLFGGSWFNGSIAGSRYANLDYWAGNSDVDISARGGSDHLNPA